MTLAAAIPIGCAVTPSSPAGATTLSRANQDGANRDAANTNGAMPAALSAAVASLTQGASPTAATSTIAATVAADLGSSALLSTRSLSASFGPLASGLSAGGAGTGSAATYGVVAAHHVDGTDRSWRLLPTTEWTGASTAATTIAATDSTAAARAALSRALAAATKRARAAAARAAANQAAAANRQASIAVQFAKAQLGKPYSWGAAGPYSYDCSGLTMAAWAAAGITLPHSAEGQYDYGTHVSLTDLRPGDLIFFYQPIGHVTIYIGDGMMISAPESGEDVMIVPVAQYLSSIVGATHLA